MASEVPASCSSSSILLCVASSSSMSKVHGFNSIASLDQASFVCALVGTERLHDAEIGGFVDAGELN